MQVPILGKEIEVVRHPPARARAGAPAIVFLHEALGSVSHWRGFPKRVADATGCESVVYSRYGFGLSTPRPEPNGPTYLQDEALVWLPAVLDALAIDRPFLFGHSDGASIALLNAAYSDRPPRAIVTVAPHVMIEEVSIAGLRAAAEQYRTTDLAERLTRHHLDAAAVFHRWSGFWLDPAHRSWSIEDCLPAISCPVLAVQGEQDGYATMEQIDRIARLSKDVRLLKLESCGHQAHRDQSDAVISATVEFIDRVLEGARG